MHQLDSALPPRAVFDRLGKPVQQLVMANIALYDGLWDDCAEDIRRRAAGRPYLYKLDLGIDDVLGWVHRLKHYEVDRGERFAQALAGEDIR